MLPPLTVAFTAGLLVGSQLPFFPCPPRSGFSSLRFGPSSSNDTTGPPFVRRRDRALVDHVSG